MSVRAAAIFPIQTHHLNLRPPHRAEFPPPKALAYNGVDLCCFTCRKPLRIFWESKAGTKWVSCFKKIIGDVPEGCVNILSEEHYDFVMSNIDEIMQESSV